MTAELIDHNITTLLSDLRDHIFMALERLSDETLTTDQVNVEVDKAKAISQLAGTLIQSAKVEIDFINATGVMESQSDLFKSVTQNKLI